MSSSVSSVRSDSPLAFKSMATTPEMDEWVKTWETVPAKGTLHSQSVHMFHSYRGFYRPH